MVLHLLDDASQVRFLLYLDLNNRNVSYPNNVSPLQVNVASRHPVMKNKLRWSLVSSLGRLPPIKAEGQTNRGVHSYHSVTSRIIIFSFQSSIKNIQTCNHKNRILYLRKRYFTFVPSAVVYSSSVAFNEVISDNTEGEL